MDLSVVIPVYGSEETLRALTERLRKVLAALKRPWEIVFVDDNSPDRAWDVLQELQAQDPQQIVLVQLMRNYGQHNALMAAFRQARGAFIVTMDDDLQNPPEEIPKLLHGIEAGNLDLVYGTFLVKKHGFWRNCASLLAGRFFRFVFRTRVAPTSFRIIRRELLQTILYYDLNFTVVDGLLAWNTQRIGEVSVDHQPRQNGRSGYSLRKLLVQAFNLFTNFSLLPLQFVSLCGFLAAGAGLLAAAYFLAQFLLHNITVPGYASTIIAVLVLGGVQLLAMGIIGEYLGRLHLNVNRKPQYNVRQVLGFPESDAPSADRVSGNQRISPQP